MYRERLQEEHNNYMLVILNEFGELKKKRTFLMRNPVFNGKSMELLIIVVDGYLVTGKNMGLLIRLVDN